MSGHGVRVGASVEKGNGKENNKTCMKFLNKKSSLLCYETHDILSHISQLAWFSVHALLGSVSGPLPWWTSRGQVCIWLTPIHNSVVQQWQEHGRFLTETNSVYEHTGSFGDEGMQNHFLVQLFHIIFRVTFLLCVCRAGGWVSGWGKHSTIKATCAVIQLVQFVVSICCPWHWESKFHVQLKMNFMFKTLHNFLSCISTSLLSRHAQPNIVLIFALIPMFSPLSLMIPSPAPHVTFQLTTLSQCRNV